MGHIQSMCRSRLETVGLRYILELRNWDARAEAVRRELYPDLCLGHGRRRTQNLNMNPARDKIRISANFGTAFRLGQKKTRRPFVRSINKPMTSLKFLLPRNTVVLETYHQNFSYTYLRFESNVVAAFGFVRIDYTVAMMEEKYISFDFGCRQLVQGRELATLF